MMKYEEFKDALLKALQEIYGVEGVTVEENLLKNNGQRYDGLQIRTRERTSIATVIHLEDIYDEYREEDLDMEGCVREVLRTRAAYACMEEVIQFADSLNYWENIREQVYPILLGTERNRELLENLVSEPLLDMSVAYIIRSGKDGEKSYSVKINRNMLAMYGISEKELHRQAMENMEKDGYRFMDIEDVIMKLIPEVDPDREITDGIEMLMGTPMRGRMYVLTNSVKRYGAAGILNKKLVKEFAGDKDYYILPSSVHETIFVPADGRMNREELDSMVAEVNSSTVVREEWLTDHSYYYDAAKDEIRICP